VTDSIDGYLSSIRDTFETSTLKISSASNNEAALDSLIENEQRSKGVEIFVIVGNDIRFPLRVSQSEMVASPVDSVLSDTDGEISYKGWNQSVKTFTAEVTVSYVFPPKQGLSIYEQRMLVANAFRKFERFHRGLLAHSNLGIACGDFDEELFRGAANSMASASAVLFGESRTIEKEMTAIEARSYFQQVPAYFGVAGHALPMSIETNSAGDQLSWADLSGSRTPTFLELFGCGTSGWSFWSEVDPWSTPGDSLPISAIFNNEYTLAAVAGFPESSTDYGFSKNVLSEFAQNSDAVLGELMINKTRRCGDWVLFGDPTLRMASVSPPQNASEPLASIDYLYPTLVEHGTAVYFQGSGTDVDGTIEAYDWRSSLDGSLSTLRAFSTTTLSTGTHTIYFKVRNSGGLWSQETERTVTVIPAPLLNITHPINEETVEGPTTIAVNAVFAGGTLRSVSFFIDGRYVWYDTRNPSTYSWDTRSYSNGIHRLRAEATLLDPLRTIVSAETTVNVNNPLPTVSIISPANGSRIRGLCPITVGATASEKIANVQFYVDGVFVAVDYFEPFEYLWNTTNTQNGLHEISATAYYPLIRQYIASQRTSVYVENPTEEFTVTILSPTSASEVNGTITICVLATGKNLNRVYFYVDQQWKGFDFTSPYTLDWNTKDTSNGPHQLIAVALYGQNAPYKEVTSQVVNVVVNNKPGA
jgi:hypothetical protein